MAEITDITIDQLFNNWKSDINNMLFIPYGEIVIFPYITNDESYKLLDKNNILKISEYPDLYKVIGDYWTDYYTNFYNSGNQIPLANKETEFMIPDLSGRYIVQKKSEGKFELTNSQLQGFDIHIEHSFAKLSLIDTEKNSFKGDQSNLSISVNTTSSPVKSIELETQFKDENLTDSQNKINIADKCVLFYMRVK